MRAGERRLGQVEHERGGRSRAPRRLALVDDLGDERADVDRRELQLEVARVEPRDAEQLVDDRGQPLRLALDVGEETSAAPPPRTGRPRAAASRRSRRSRSAARGARARPWRRSRTASARRPARRRCRGTRRCGRPSRRPGRASPPRSARARPRCRRGGSAPAGRRRRRPSRSGARAGAPRAPCGRAPPRRDAGDPLGGRVPEDDPLVAVDGDDPVGDVREDGDAALALERDLLVELGLREGDRSVRRRARRAPRSPPPATSAAGARRQPARRGARPRRRRAARRGRRRSRARAAARPRAADRLRLTSSRRQRRTRSGHRRRRAGDRPASRALDLRPRRLRAAARRRARRRRAAGSTRRRRRSSAGACSTTSSRTAAGSSSPAKQRRRCWASCCGEQPRAALDLVELAALERALARRGELAGEVELVVGEVVRLAEEDEGKRAPLAARKRDRDRERAMRLSATSRNESRSARRPQRGARRSSGAPAPRARAPRRRSGSPCSKAPRSRSGRSCAPASRKPSGAGHQDGGRGRRRTPRQAACATASSVAVERDGLAEQVGDPREPRLDARLPLTLLEALGVPERERRERGERRRAPRRRRRRRCAFESRTPTPRTPRVSPARLHRRDHRAREAPVGRVCGTGSAIAVVRRRARRGAPCEGPPARPAVGRELAADRAPGRGRERPRSAATGRLGRTGSSRPRPRRAARATWSTSSWRTVSSAELAGHDLRGLEQRGLLLRARMLFSRSRRAGVDAEPELARRPPPRARSPMPSRRWASGRCRASTPIVRSRTTIGVANDRAGAEPAARPPDPRPRAPTRDVRDRDRPAAPRRRGSRPAAARASGWPTGVGPSAAHSASIGRPWPCSPRRTKQRASPTARAGLLDARRAGAPRDRAPIAPSGRSTRPAARDRAPPGAPRRTAPARARARPRPRASAAGPAPPARTRAAHGSSRSRARRSPARRTTSGTKAALVRADRARRPAG